MLTKNLRFNALKTCIILILSTAIAFFLLFLVFSIPNRYIEDSREDLKNCMDIETPGWKDIRFFTYAWGSKNMPDSFIYRLLAVDESRNVLYTVAGGSDEGDNRYWDGFMVFIRPLMVFFSYGQLRFLFTMLDLLLIWYILILSNRRLPLYVGFSFFMGLFFINMLVNFYSLMLNMLFIVAFSFSALMLKLYSEKTSLSFIYYAFLINGILTTYLDRYTASLVSLELPLFFIIMINIYDKGALSLKKNLQTVLAAICGWGIGFSVFWFNKWIIGGLILGRNTLGSAFDQAMFRATTNAPVEQRGTEITGNRFFTIIKNIGSLAPTHGENMPAVAVVFVCALIILAALLIIKKGKLSDPVKYVPLLILMIMPYVYYFVFSNLNQIHATFYMYRMQLPVIMGAVVLYFDALKHN